MAHFYASINAPSRKTNPTARGHKTTGLSAHIRGWNAGVFVEAGQIDGRDAFKVYTTGGSNGAGYRELAGVFVEGLGWEPAKR